MEIQTCKSNPLTFNRESGFRGKSSSETYKIRTYLVLNLAFLKVARPRHPCNKGIQSSSWQPNCCKPQQAANCCTRWQRPPFGVSSQLHLRIHPDHTRGRSSPSLGPFHALRPTTSCQALDKMERTVVLGQWPSQCPWITRHRLPFPAPGSKDTHHLHNFYSQVWRTCCKGEA